MDKEFKIKHFFSKKNNKKIEDSVLEFNNVSMEYRKKSNIFALDNASFVVRKGDFHAFLGSNGAGKSTAIKILVGMNNDYDGDVLINGINTKQGNDLRKKLCYVPDSCKFPNEFTLEKFLLECALLVREDKMKILEEIEIILKKFDMYKYRKKISNRLSAGERQKVSLMRILLERPEILVLDEPFSNLDPKSRFDWMNILKEINSFGTTIFLSSHIINDLVGFVNSGTFIEHGKILFNGYVGKNDLKEKYFNFILKGEKGYEYEI
ncbi:MAG: ABC transporter ATP-binding protein [Malacoplasma sp.]|nr:ABC transporter ATP-binding protein [Malacoplasma sp.]